MFCLKIYMSAFTHILVCVCVCESVCVCVCVCENSVVEGSLSSESKYLILNLESSVQVNFRLSFSQVLSFEALGHFLFIVIF